MGNCLDGTMVAQNDSSNQSPPSSPSPLNGNSNLRVRGSASPVTASSTSHLPTPTSPSLSEVERFIQTSNKQLKVPSRLWEEENAVIDFKTALRSLGNDKQFLFELLGDVLTSLPGFVERTRAAIHSDNHETFVLVATELKFEVWELSLTALMNLTIDLTNIGKYLIDGGSEANLGNSTRLMCLQQLEAEHKRLLSYLAKAAPETFTEMQLKLPEELHIATTPSTSHISSSQSSSLRDLEPSRSQTASKEGV